MALYRLDANRLERLPEASFDDSGPPEHERLHALLRDQPEVVEDGLLVIAEHFGDWSDGERVDLLALDGTGRLVLIELMRDDDDYMELRALRNAAMVANMTFDQVVEHHSDYLRSRGVARDPRRALIDFLEQETIDEPQIESRRPRIVLVGREFSADLTASVLWLIESGIELRCVRVRPYSSGEGVMLDIAQVIPLSGTGDYATRMRRKAHEDEMRSGRRRERTVQTLARQGAVKGGTELVIFAASLDTREAIDLDDPRYHAELGDHPTAVDNVLWAYDGKRYSLTSLTEKMRSEHGIPVPDGPLNGYMFWCLADRPGSSLYQLAEEASRN